MARDVKNKVQAFNLMMSEGVQENERILEQGPQTNDKQEHSDVQAHNATQEAPLIPQPEPASQSTESVVVPTDIQAQEETPQTAQEADAILPKTPRSTRKSLFGSSPLKSEKGVKVMLPMDYYFKLVRLKECSGKTLQELAAQGVMEFIDKYVK